MQRAPTVHAQYQIFALNDKRHFLSIINENPGITLPEVATILNIKRPTLQKQMLPYLHTGIITRRTVTTRKIQLYINHALVQKHVHTIKNQISQLPKTNLNHEID